MGYDIPADHHGPLPSDYREPTLEEKAARYDAIMVKVQALGHTSAVVLIDALVGRIATLEAQVTEACQKSQEAAQDTFNRDMGRNQGLCYQHNWCQKYGGTLRPLEPEPVADPPPDPGAWQWDPRKRRCHMHWCKLYEGHSGEHTPHDFFQDTVTRAGALPDRAPDESNEVTCTCGRQGPKCQLALRVESPNSLWVEGLPGAIAPGSSVMLYLDANRLVKLARLLRGLLVDMANQV